MSETELQTERLRLRPVTPHDSGRITGIVNDPRIYRMVARIPPGQTKAQTLAWIATHAESRAASKGYVFGVETGGVLQGVIGAHRAEIDEPFEIGYWLAPEAWGKGYCSEAGAALIRWLTGGFGVRALVAGHFTDNPASGRVLQKLGFLPCGRGPMFSLGRGEKSDHIMMSRIL